MAMHSKGVQGAGWLNIVIGALVFLTPFFTATTAQGPLWSGLLSGAAVILLAGFNVYAGAKRNTENAFGPAILNVLIGIWVLLSGFVLATALTYTWTMAVLGAVLIVSAGYNTWAASDARRTHAPMR